MAAANFTAHYQPTKVKQQAPVLTEHGSRVELIKNGFCPDCGFQLRKKVMFGRWKTLHEICPRESSHAAVAAQSNQQHGIATGVPQTSPLPQKPTTAVPSVTSSVVNQSVPPAGTVAAAEGHSRPIASAPPFVPSVPPPVFRPPTGGACTAAFLRGVEASPAAVAPTWQGLLLSMVTELHEMGLDRTKIPTLTSGTLLNAHDPMSIVPSGYNGSRRAILIGINYVGQSNALSGRHKDVDDMKRYLIHSQGFEEKEILILKDDNAHHPPTRQKIIEALSAMAQYSSAGDVVFVYYSGRGTRTSKKSNNTCLVPLDSNAAGLVNEKDIMKALFEPMKSGVHSMLLFDCVDSGMVLDLPYCLSAKNSIMQSKGGASNRSARKKNATCICLGLVPPM